MHPEERTNFALNELNDELAEGRLHVDIAETPQELIITAPMAGVDPADVTVNLSDDVLTIRGERKAETTISEHDYFSQECFWGKFSRSIILPVDVKIDAVEATFKNGLLKIVFPKQTASQHIPIVVIDEQ